MPFPFPIHVLHIAKMSITGHLEEMKCTAIELEINSIFIGFMSNGQYFDT